ncbi:MAG: hypothetical protein HXX17_09715 [Geobacteraceae bacterium]|nr:hypothetical protein [Geobacteraceae bacterium]
MKLMPMGDYYLWHCDWCDSTNYTIWTRLERDGLTCSACHHQFAATNDNYPLFTPLKVPDNRFQSLTL